MAFKAKDRQRIIEGYLAESGRNIFVPSDFIRWMEVRPEHEAYGLFFGISEEKAAFEYRVELARRFASGLRVTVSQSQKDRNVVRVTTREYPAYVSPTEGRRSGGGYVPFDETDPAHQAELRRQGATALRGWLSRYRGAFEAAGVDLSAIEAVAGVMDVEAA
jgi:hypothetical protein